MSNVVDLRVNRSLELLASLKETAAAFAKREDQLTRELNSSRYASNRKIQEEVDKADAHFSGQIAQTDAYFQQQAVRIKAIYDGRLARVQNFRATTLKNLPKRAEETRGKWLGDLQMRKYKAQRKMTADMEEADADYPTFAAELEKHQQKLLLLERRARKAMAGYFTLSSKLRRKSAESIDDKRLSEMNALLRENLKIAESELIEFEQFPIPRFFASAPLPLFLVLSLAAAGGLAWYLGLNTNAYVTSGFSFAVVFGVIWIVHAVGLTKVKKMGLTIAHALVESRGVIAACIANASAMEAKREPDRQRIQEENNRAMAEIQELWNRADDVAINFENKVRKKIALQSERLGDKIAPLLQAKLERIEGERLGWSERLKGEAAAYKQQVTDYYANDSTSLVSNEKVRWDEIEADWKRQITPIYQAIEVMNTVATSRFPAWSAATVEGWKPAAAFTPIAQFGHLSLDLSKSPAGLPKDPRLALPGPAKVSLPLALTFPYQGSLLFETNDSGEPDVVGTLNNIMMRMLSSTPPGKVSFTIIDPVGLGQSFAGFMYLADYQEALINRRIWTQRDQIEERLAEFGEHIEKVIQMYLRNEYETITEYNAAAGSVAEKYHFLVVADFPANFSDIAAKRLQSIAQSGPRCGIFTLMHWDLRQPKPGDFVPEEIQNNSVCLRRASGELVLNQQQIDLGAKLTLDPPPDAELAAALVHKIGKASVDSNRVQVPFVQIAPKPEEMWTAETTNELRISIGRTGATKQQYLAIGKGTRQHALFAGKTGSGKSTLFHVIITNLALAYSPEQVEFYLIDFKKGVEFKCYASRHLPHAKVIAVESDREFALSVLQRVDAELKRRGDMFRKLGAQDVAGYKRQGGTEPMPRSLLIIDEFQEFFVEDDPTAQAASLLFDRIVRQGRAFGIHVLLGSQTLGGAYSLARATLGQMAIRVALQCNEADAYLIMDENNSAPRLLSRPGEGIYNDAAGAVEGNSPFQVVWLPDDERDGWLDKVHDLMEHHPEMKYSRPIVFEGNAPSDIRENELLRDALESAPTAPPVTARCWLGAPNSIKGPTEAAFQRQSGNNLLIVGQRDEAVTMMVGISMLALAAQFPKGTVKFVLFDGSLTGSPESEFMAQIVKAIPHEVVVAQGQEITAAMNDLATELKARSSNETNTNDAPVTFLFILGLHKFKKLRQEDDFSFSMDAETGPNPAVQFGQLLSEGSGFGIHVITVIDTLNSVNRFMNRKALSEFEMRVVFQMSANDSASLIDSPKASNLGLHRALYFNEHEGYLETFRPYAPPEAEWIQAAGEKLAHRGEVAAATT